MIQAKPFIEQFGSFSTFARLGSLLDIWDLYRQPFSVDMLANPHDKESKKYEDAEKQVLFAGWRRNVVAEYKNDTTDRTLHFLLNSGKMSVYRRRETPNTTKVTVLPQPQTVDDFIRACQMEGIELIWKGSVAAKYCLGAKHEEPESVDSK